MPNIKSAKKRVLVAQKKALENKAVKTNLKTVLKKADAAVAAGAADSADAIRVAIKKVDQAASKNILHKNAAAHRKSALMKKLAAAKYAAPCSLFSVTLSPPVAVLFVFPGRAGPPVPVDGFPILRYHSSW